MKLFIFLSFSPFKFSDLRDIHDVCTVCSLIRVVVVSVELFLSCWGERNWSRNEIDRRVGSLCKYFSLYSLFTMYLESNPDFEIFGPRFSFTFSSPVIYESIYITKETSYAAQNFYDSIDNPRRQEGLL